MGTHREGFCLMKYQTDDGSETEMLWNSRDGVTPFGINSLGGKPMHHVEWNKDVYDPNFIPPPGMRVFVDATLQLVKPELEKYIDKIWKMGARETFGTKGEAFKRLLDSWLREGAPWVITTPEARVPPETK